MSDVAGGILGMIGTLGAAGIGAGSAAALAEKNREWTEKMWHLQNEYNTPSAQMARLKEAGLNPNLAYGSVSSGNAEAPKYQDVYGSGPVSQALSKINIVSAAVEAIKGIEEIKQKKLENEGISTQNQMSQEQLDQYLNQRAAQTWYSQEHSEFGKWARENGYSFNYATGAFENAEGPTMQVLKFKTAGYLYDQLKLNLRNLEEGIHVKTSLDNLRKVTSELYGLNIPYFKTRNAWQPWQYGTEIGTSVFNSLTSGVTSALKLALPKQAPAGNSGRRIVINNF